MSNALREACPICGHVRYVGTRDAGPCIRCKGLAAVLPRSAPGEWVAEAACAEIGGDNWYPEPGDSHTARRAIAVCRGCPVRQACLEYALANGEQWGIWGGLTAGQRRYLRSHPKGTTTIRKKKKAS